MEIVFKTASTDRDFEGILALQQQNLYTAISQEAQVQQGFVFAQHTLDLLRTMAAELPQVIAIANNRVVGYNLAMTADMKAVVPSIIPMFDAFENCTYQGRPLASYRYLVGGQVCVAHAFRGQGLLSKLYHATKSLTSDEYQFCVTEISTRNLLSLKIHQRMGFEIIGNYYDGQEHWNVVLWDFRR